MKAEIPLNPTDASVDPIIRQKDVQHMTGVRKSMMYDLISRGEFPKPIPLGRSAVGWATSEIAAWIEARKAERDQKEAA